MTDELDLSERISAALARVDASEDPDVAFAGVPMNWRKWMDDAAGDGIVFLGRLTEDELRQGDARIAPGEDAVTVCRTSRRATRGAGGVKATGTLAEIARDEYEQNVPHGTGSQRREQAVNPLTPNRTHIVLRSVVTAPDQQPAHAVRFR